MNNEEEQLGHSVVEGLTLLLTSDSENAKVFRSSGGVKICIALINKMDNRHLILGKLLFIMYNELDYKKIGMCSYSYNLMRLVWKDLTKL